MQVRSCLVYLIVKNTIVKTEFKIYYKYKHMCRRLIVRYLYYVMKFDAPNRLRVITFIVWRTAS
jgi:hypothetical protein